MFVNTRYLSPVVMDGLTAAPPDSYEYMEWWDEQWARCLNGYSAGGTTITGPHYFYLNFWKIRAEQEGMSGKRLMHPRFLDIDYEFFWEVEKCERTGKDLLVLKRRQAGFSYKSSCLAAYDYTFKPDSLCLILSGEEKYAKNTFRFVRAGLNELVDGEFYKNRLINSMEHIKSGYKVTVDGREREEGFFSEVMRMTVADPQAPVGTSPSRIIYEEIGKFKGLIDTHAYMLPAMEAQGRKTGMSVMIGTGGEDNTSIDEVTTMFYKPKVFGLMEYDNTWDDETREGIPAKDRKKVAYFVPGDRFTQHTDKDGNSLIPESRKMIAERRRIKEGDKRAWLKEVTQFPLTPEEALLVPDGNAFNIQKLRARLIEIMKSQVESDKLQLYDLDWKRDSQNNVVGVEFIHNPVGGRFRVTEMPVRDHQGEVPRGVYLASTDSYDKDKVASVNDGSFGSCGIFKTFWDADPLGSSDKFVCSLTERPPTADEFYEDTAKMCVAYGWAMNLIEHSNLLIGNWYTQNGFVRLLKERPEVAYAMTIKASASQNNWGIETTTKPYWIQALADYIETSAHKFDDEELIKALIAYKNNDPDYNCDRTIMMALGITHRNEVIHVMKKPKIVAPPFGRRFAMRAGGRMVGI